MDAYFAILLMFILLGLMLAVPSIMFLKDNNTIIIEKRDYL